MERKNLNALPDYSQRMRGKQPALEPPKPSASEEKQLELAKQRSLLDQGGRHAFQVGSSRPLSPNSEKEKKREAAATRYAARMEGDPRPGAGSHSAILPVVAAGALVVHTNPLEVQGCKRSLTSPDERPDSSKLARVDHRWGFRYVDRDIPFFSNTDACAMMFRDMGSGPGSFPHVESLKEREAYENACRKSCEVSFLLFFFLLSSNFLLLISVMAGVLGLEPRCSALREASEEDGCRESEFLRFSRRFGS